MKVSEPDLRTPEERLAAREASRSVPGLRKDPHALYSTQPVRSETAQAGDNTGKADG